MPPVLPTPTAERQRRQYQKTREIGRGTFGVVWLVRDSRTASTLVMKEVSLKGLPLKEQKASMNEVRVLQALKHPHIIAYQDSFVTQATRTESANLCIVMEWASGGDLGSLIARRKQIGQRFSEAEVTKYTWQMCSALAHCHHGLKLLHRDLKPANIFLTATGDIKIGDFGISRFLSTSGQFAQTQCGTPLYMSPEMAQGKSYTRAADIWATGCIIYEMMALSAPWLAQIGAKAARELNVVGLMRYIARDVLQVDGLRKYYSAELCALLVALVSRDPMNRPSLASVLEWPVMRDSAWGREHARFLPKVKRGPSDGAEPLGSEKHAAAQVLQRSFKRSFGKRAAAPKPAPVELSEGEVELDATLPNDHAAAAQPKPGDRNFDPTAAAAANYARHAAMIAAKAAIRREAPPPPPTPREAPSRVDPAIERARAAYGAFMPCSKFKGHQPGYVFKNGRSGLGYYRDRPSPRPLPSESPSVPLLPLAPPPSQRQRPPPPPPPSAQPTIARHHPNAAPIARPPRAAYAAPTEQQAPLGRVPSSARLAKVPSAAGLMLQSVPSASAAVAAAQAARKAADAAAQARDEAAKATRNAVDKILARNPSAPQITKIPSWDEPQQPVREAFEAKEEPPPRPRRDPVAANEALRAAMAAGRPDEVRAAAAAAQKIIDSFKRSQKRRRAVAAGEQPPRLYDPAPAQPYLQPQPTPVQRRTLNRRMSPRGVVQAQPTPRMGPPRSARVRVEQHHAAPSRVSELKRYYEPVPLA